MPNLGFQDGSKVTNKSPQIEAKQKLNMCAINIPLIISVLNTFKKLRCNFFSKIIIDFFQLCATFALKKGLKA